MNRKTLFALGASLLLIVSIGAYAVQFGILGIQPGLAETDDGGVRPVMNEPSENWTEGPVMVSNKSNLTVEQTGSAESDTTDSGYTCVDDDRSRGVQSLTTDVVQLNQDRDRGDPIYYRMDFNGTVVVENSNREVYVQDYIEPTDESNGKLILGLRQKHSGEPAHDCPGELSFSVGIRYDNNIPDVTPTFNHTVAPPANATASE